MKYIGSYRYGSTIEGTNIDTSDIDYGEVVFGGWETVIHLNKSAMSFSSHPSKKVNGNDLEMVDLIDWFRWALLPPPIFHSKLASFESPVINKTQFTNMVELGFYWKSYLYKCISFVKSCDVSTDKGLRQAAYCTDLATFQFENSKFLVDPKFWQNKPMTLTYRFIHNVDYPEVLRVAVNTSMMQLEDIAKEQPDDVYYTERYRELMYYFLYVASDKKLNNFCLS